MGLGAGRTRCQAGARLSGCRAGRMLSSTLFQGRLRPVCVLATEECSLGGDGQARQECPACGGDRSSQPRVLLPALSHMNFFFLFFVFLTCLTSYYSLHSALHRCPCGDSLEVGSCFQGGGKGHREGKRERGHEEKGREASC